MKKEKGKKNSIKWDSSCREKIQNGLGLKDLKKHGIALVVQWIIKAPEGEEPWKIVVKNNFQLVVPKEAKTWKTCHFVIF